MNTGKVLGRYEVLSGSIPLLASLVTDGFDCILLFVLVWKSSSVATLVYLNNSVLF